MADGRGCRQQEAPHTKCSLYCLLNDVLMLVAPQGASCQALEKGWGGGGRGWVGSRELRRLVRIITIGETVAFTCVFTRGGAQKKAKVTYDMEK